MAPLVDILGLVVVRGAVRAVDGVDLALEPGTVTGLLGPSGCGKTTLMRSIVGSQQITSGSVAVAGHPAGSQQTRLLVGYMAQENALYDDLSIEENIRYFATVLAAPPARVDAVIELTDLASRRRALVRTLSGGEANRTSLAIALLHEPPVLVLDEPTVGLDPILRRRLWDVFRTLADAGTTLLVSSHVMEEAERCDRLLLMRTGRLLFDGTKQELVSAAGTDDVESAFIRLAEGAAS